MNDDRIVGNCPRCGVPYDSTAEFCSKCGAYLITNIKFKQGRQMPSYEDKVNTMYNDAQYCLHEYSEYSSVLFTSPEKIWLLSIAKYIAFRLILRGLLG